MDRFSQIVLTALMCVVALGQFVQVLTRYVFQIPVMGLEETIMFPTLWLYVLGAVNASREGTHISANVLEIFLKTERQHTILAIIGEVVSLGIGIWLTLWAWDYVQYAWRVWRESPTLYIPTFYGDLSLFVGMVFMMTYNACHLITHIKRLKMASIISAGELK